MVVIRLPLSDEIAVAIAQVVNDATPVPTRKPSHADIESLVYRYKLVDGDPNLNGFSYGKAKRVNAILIWAIEYDLDAGEAFISALLSLIKGLGGFRQESPNYVGEEAIQNLKSSFEGEGISLASDGVIMPLVLDNFSDKEIEKFLQSYIRRAKKGASDAALLAGTGKDLLEAVAAHVITRILGDYPQKNFPTLLGLAFHLLELSTPKTEGKSFQTKRFEISLYELGCTINNMRNKQGTGHGRPFLPTISEAEAKAAIEGMGMISEFLLSKLKNKFHN
ncbi:abortive infection family protein [Bacillus nakamurai]|nr:abortive infection family protein [Bacillus nakamurai]MCP6682298.1 abortive infection family protein [Bacillus nakamurai]